MHRIRVHRYRPLVFVLLLLMIIAFIAEVHFVLYQVMDTQLTIFCLLSCMIAIAWLLYLIIRQHMLSVVFLLTVFFSIMSWRLSVLAQMIYVPYIFLVILVVQLIFFALIAWDDIQDKKIQLEQDVHYHHTCFEWQLLFIRMFIGFDMIPHFCEKLFAGNYYRMNDVHAFIHLGVPHAFFFVVLAGLCEFFGALSISCGFITRLGAIGVATYLMVATYLGHHFSHGFIWASKGGGWEYPVLWSCLIVSFAFFGAGRFSVDYVLKKKFRLSFWQKMMMGGPVH